MPVHQTKGPKQSANKRKKKKKEKKSRNREKLIPVHAE